MGQLNSTCVPGTLWANSQPHLDAGVFLQAVGERGGAHAAHVVPADAERLQRAVLRQRLRNRARPLVVASREWATRCKKPSKSPRDCFSLIFWVLNG